MNNLTQKVTSENKKKLEDELNNANEELRKIDKLLQLVQSGSTNSVPIPDVTTSKPKLKSTEPLPPPPPKKSKVSKPPLPKLPEPKMTPPQPDFVPEYDDDYSEVPMQFHMNQ